MMQVGIRTSVTGNVEVQRMTSSLLSLFYRKSIYQKQTEGFLGWAGLVFLLGLKRFHSRPFSGPAETRTSSTEKIKFTPSSISALRGMSKATLKIIVFSVSRANCHRLSLQLSRQRLCLQCRRSGFDPWVGKIPWRRKWQPIPVPLPGKSHGQKSLVGCSPWGRKESGTTGQLTLPSLPIFCPVHPGFSWLTANY